MKKLSIVLLAIYMMAAYYPYAKRGWSAFLVDVHREANGR